MSQNQNNNSPSGPITEEEWIVHVLNIHGLFFERWCEHAVAITPGFSVVDRNRPVEFPPVGMGFPTREGELDLEIYHQFGQNDQMSLIVECKKNNPDFTNWIFFPTTLDRNTLEIPMVRTNLRNVDSTRRWNMAIERTETYMEITYTDECRETKSEYQATTES